MPSKRKNRSNNDAAMVSKKASIPQQGPEHRKSDSRTFEGDGLSSFLKLIHWEIELQRLANKLLPEKIWFKKQFAIGMNEVTRCLERMPLSTVSTQQQMQESQNQGEAATVGNRCAFPATNRLQVCCVLPNPMSVHAVGLLYLPFCLFNGKIQAVVVAWDCNPKWLTKHLPSLAYSRDVPIIYVRDEKRGSVRLGELLRIKTAIAVGVKANGNGINQLMERILLGEELNEGEEKPDLTELPNMLPS